MLNPDLLPSLLFKINENQLALEAAIMELTLWVEQRGAAEVGNNIRGALYTIDRNEEFIKMTLSDDDFGVTTIGQRQTLVRWCDGAMVRWCDGEQLTSGPSTAISRGLSSKGNDAFVATLARIKQRLIRPLHSLKS